MSQTRAWPADNVKQAFFFQPASLSYGCSYLNALRGLAHSTLIAVTIANGASPRFWRNPKALVNRLAGGAIWQQVGLGTNAVFQGIDRHGGHDYSAALSAHRCHERVVSLHPPG